MGDAQEDGMWDAQEDEVASIALFTLIDLTSCRSNVTVDGCMY